MTYEKITRLLTIDTLIKQINREMRLFNEHALDRIRALEQERTHLQEEMKADAPELPTGDAITPESTPTGLETNPQLAMMEEQRQRLLKADEIKAKADELMARFERLFK